MKNEKYPPLPSPHPPSKTQNLKDKKIKAL
jgi:hypothetical protein